MLITVFHVTDLDGNKITDKSVINYIEQVILNVRFFIFVRINQN